MSVVAEEDHTDADCFVLAISSHGDEIIQKLPKDEKQVRQDVVFCTDFFMQTRDLVFAFSDSQCPTLTGKPRLFFIQVLLKSFFLMMVYLKIIEACMKKYCLKNLL